MTDCYVETNKQAHFEQIQKEVWNKGIMYSPGILSAFGKKQNGRYLVASLWDNEYSYQRYVDKELGVKETTQHITGSLIELHPKWAVI